jgi:hypothetical protein
LRTPTPSLIGGKESQVTNGKSPFYYNDDVAIEKGSRIFAKEKVGMSRQGVCGTKEAVCLRKKKEERKKKEVGRKREI